MTELKEYASKREEEMMFDEVLGDFSGDVESAEQYIRSLEDLGYEEDPADGVSEEEEIDTPERYPSEKRGKKQADPVEDDADLLKDSDAGSGFKLQGYTHKFDFDGKQQEIRIEDEHHLKSILEKAAVADQVWEETRELRENYDDLVKEAEFGDFITKAIEERPLEVANEVIANSFFGSNPQAALQWLAHTYHQLDAVLKDPNQYRNAMAAWNANNRSDNLENGRDTELSKREKELQERERRTALEIEERKLGGIVSELNGQYSKHFTFIEKQLGDSQWVNNITAPILEKYRNMVAQGKFVSKSEVEREVLRVIRPMYNSLVKASKQAATTQPNPSNKSSSSRNFSGTSNAGKRSSKRPSLADIERREAEKIWE